MMIQFSLISQFLNSLLFYYQINQFRCIQLPFNLILNNHPHILLHLQVAFQYITRFDLRKYWQLFVPGLLRVKGIVVINDLSTESFQLNYLIRIISNHLQIHRWIMASVNWLGLVMEVSVQFMPILYRSFRILLNFSESYLAVSALTWQLMILQTIFIMASACSFTIMKL